MANGFERTAFSGIDGAVITRRAVRACLDDLVAETVAGTGRSTPLGNDRFRQDVEKILGRKIGQSRRGRPFSKRSGVAVEELLDLFVTDTFNILSYYIR